MSGFNFMINDPAKGFNDNMSFVSMGDTSSHPIPVVLGENVFDMFAQKEAISNLPLGEAAAHELAQTVDSPVSSSTNTPSTCTISPMELLNLTADDVLTNDSSSPMFQDLDLDPNNWTSLFDNEPMESSASPSAVNETKPSSFFDFASKPTSNVESSVSPVKVETSISVHSAPTVSQRPLKRSLDSSDSLVSESSKRKKSTTKVDHLGCVAYNRKQRSAPLDPIVMPTTGDSAAVKRARNTEAARRSRARKMERMNQLEDKVEELLQRNSDLEAEVERLRSLLGERAN